MTLPKSLESISTHAFRGCTGLTSLTLWNGLEFIGESAFEDTRLTSLTLPNTVKALGIAAFTGNHGLASVILPHALILGNNAFRRCWELTSVVFRPPVSRGAFIAWSVGSSRHRANWKLTTVERLRNVLRLITMFDLWSRDVSSVDPDRSRGVFLGCALSM